MASLPGALITPVETFAAPQARTTHQDRHAPWPAPRGARQAAVTRRRLEIEGDRLPVAFDAGASTSFSTATSIARYSADSPSTASAKSAARWPLGRTEPRTRRGTSRGQFRWRAQGLHARVGHPRPLRPPPWHTAEQPRLLDDISLRKFNALARSLPMVDMTPRRT